LCICFFLSLKMTSHDFIFLFLKQLQQFAIELMAVPILEFRAGALRVENSAPTARISDGV